MSGRSESLWLSQCIVDKLVQLCVLQMIINYRQEGEAEKKASASAPYVRSNSTRLLFLTSAVLERSGAEHHALSMLHRGSGAGSSPPLSLRLVADACAASYLEAKVISTGDTVLPVTL